MGRTNWLILLPPSEGKAEGGRTNVPWSVDSGMFGMPFMQYRREVATRLAAIGGGNSALLGAKGALLDRARASNTMLIGAPTLPAWRRYTGVVWDHLDLESFSSDVRSACTRRILVPSALAGLCAASDPLPDYRLKMGARLTPFGTLAAWWRAPISTALASRARGRMVIDLLPQEHRAAIDGSLLPGLVRVDLVSRSGGVVGGHNAKAAKGLLARHLLTASSGSLETRVTSFVHPQYLAKITKRPET